MARLNTSHVRIDLMIIELDLVSTFMRIARTSPNPETRKRNRTYAREAYQMASRLRSQISFSPRMNRAIQAEFSGAAAELGIAASA